MGHRTNHEDNFMIVDGMLEIHKCEMVRNRLPLAIPAHNPSLQHCVWLRLWCFVSIHGHFEDLIPRVFHLGQSAGVWLIEIQNLEGEMVGENTFPLLKVFGKVNIVLLLWYISYSSTKFEDGYLMPTSKIKLVPKLRLSLSWFFNQIQLHWMTYQPTNQRLTILGSCMPAHPPQQVTECWFMASVVSPIILYL